MFSSNRLKYNPKQAWKQGDMLNNRTVFGKVFKLSFLCGSAMNKNHLRISVAKKGFKILFNRRLNKIFPAPSGASRDRELDKKLTWIVVKIQFIK
jgi:hypothetical protein